MINRISRSKHGPKLTPLSTTLLVFLIAYTVLLFALVYWGFITSFKEYDEEILINGNYGFAFPQNFNGVYYSYFFNNFTLEVLRHGEAVKSNLFDMFHNSLVYAIGCAFFQTIVPCLTAYVCARYKFKFLKIYPTVVIITMAIPIVGATSSEIMMARNIGIYGELWGMWIMKANFLGLYFLIFYSSFKSLPDAYAEAAKIDGANNFKLLFKISLPMVKNTFLTIFLIYFISFWNDYQTPLLYLRERPTLFYSLYKVFTVQGVQSEISNVCATCALAIIGLLPTSLTFILFHKKLLGNVTVGGIK